MSRAKGRTNKPVGAKFNNGNDKMYWRVSAEVDGKIIQPLAHRVMWILAHGPIPEGMTVDHIDNDGLNNALSNLRLASKSEQARNRRVMSHSQSGMKGVRITRYGTFEASIMVAGTRFHLGSFSSPEEAHQAYCQKAKEIHGLFHRSE